MDFDGNNANFQSSDRSKMFVVMDKYQCQAPEGRHNIGFCPLKKNGTENFNGQDSFGFVQRLFTQFVCCNTGDTIVRTVTSGIYNGIDSIMLPSDTF
jgi:hypothetical protein